MSEADPDDLWPAEVAQEIKIETPASIVAKQAALLGQKTKNVVTAELIRVRTPTEGRMIFGFNLVAPGLSNYKVRIFTFAYDLATLYPASVYDFALPGFAFSEAKSETQRKETLRSIFGNEGFIRMIQALRAQSESLGGVEETCRFETETGCAVCLQKRPFRL